MIEEMRVFTEVKTNWFLKLIVSHFNSIEQCISNAKTWMFHNKLQMNDDKTEAILSA